MKSNELFHISVLLDKSIELLNIKEDGLYLDMTLGAGGHSQAILDKLGNKGSLIAFDQDMLAINNAKERFKDYPNFRAIHSNFSNVENKLAELGINRVDGIIYDLGVSSMQLDIAERGFSYNHDALLDMRMNQEQTLSAYEVVNEYCKKDLLYILRKYGEEGHASLIVKGIIKARNKQAIKTTYELVDIIKQSLPQKVLKKKGHPAKLTFQAIRMEVNQELVVIEQSLHQALRLLNVNGRIVVISFHSLEDRLVKNIFKEYTTSQLPKELVDVRGLENIEYQLINKKVILPNEKELLHNNRAHSSKLRGIKRIIRGDENE
ncbi:MAG: 16S rRNA (cytosine(1402)-N(4))-methyltransferase RsmH [Bacilli bacterium]|nr:16S rRNA (cytosine(1402)-N(4))-methyltransferase RsmH [Bacilli bacterium]